jgi:uncharacterized membrane protein YhhN
MIAVRHGVSIVPNIEPLDRGLVLLSIAAAIAYFVTRPLQPFPGSVVIKALGMAPLAVVSFRVLGRAEGAAPTGGRRSVSDGVLLATALALSCLGDVLLHLGFRRYFGVGLGAFLLAHVAYTVLFVRCWPRPFRPHRRQLALAAVVIVYGLVVTGWLSSQLGGYSIPVIAYAIAITAMTVAAILAGFSTPFVWMGAMLFVLSDSLIAAGRFRAAVPLAAYLIWPTYYLGQYGIAVGFLREKVGDRPE